MRLRDKVDVLSAPSAADNEDDLGHEAPSWADAIPVREPATVQPLGSNEIVLSADTVVTRYKATLLPNTTATSSSRLVWRGDTFEVDGDVALTVDRAGRPHHREALLVRVRG